MKTIFIIFAIISLQVITCGAIPNISLSYGTSYQTAIALSYSNPNIVGNTLNVTVQITNTSGTWVYIQQNTTSSTPSPVGLPYTVYLLGPNGSKTFTNIQFTTTSYLEFDVTTPIGLDFTTIATDPKPRALFGAMIVDCMTRGLLTFPLPANAFDEPFNSTTGVVDPVLDNIVSTLQLDDSYIGSAAVHLKNRDWVKLSVDFGQIASQIASESSALQNSISQLLQKANVGLSSGDVGNFFSSASTWLGKIADVLDIPEKYAMLQGLTQSTFDASLTSTNRFDVVVTTPAPFISSVSPTSMTGLPLPQTQIIHIYGSGFTTNSTLIFNSTTLSDPARLTLISPNEIDYLIRTDTNAATWFVMVIDGSQFSNLGYFSVIAPPATPAGSLTVNLLPAGAVSAGAQWQVDGTGYNNSGQTIGYLTPGSHSVTFKPVSSYTAPASFTANIVANQTTTSNATYSAVTAATYMLTLNAGSGQGGITPLPIGVGGGNTFTYNSGSAVQLTATAAMGYHFTSWSGDVSGVVSPTTITLNGNKNVTANFAVGDQNLATISVTLQPSAAVTAGAQWKFNSSGWMNSGSSTTTVLLGTNQNLLQFQAAAGWITPASFYVTTSGGQTTNVSVTYQQDQTPGLLTVTLSPPDAVTAGAHWHVNGGIYGNGASASLPPGNYTVTFDNINGWAAPASQLVTMLQSQSKVIAGNYTPPIGQPAIYSVSPPIGGMTGGTLLTINGVNFTQATTVLVGGQPATNISVANATQITCFTPASSTNGSVPIVIQTTSGSATNQNGFAYGVSRGNKLDLINAIGGVCYGVAVSGNYAYVGEGRNLLVVDVSNQSNPSRVGSVTLPGIVQDIAVFGHYACVADGEGGLQIVDVNTPSTPIISGFNVVNNYTYASGIFIYGGRAYVADRSGSTGLEIFDLGNPAAPALLSATSGGGQASKVLVKASAGGVFAYLTAGQNLQVIDVSNPSVPVLRGTTSIGWNTYSIAMSGNYIYAATYNGSSDLEIIDVSNTNAPTVVGNAPNVTYSVAVTVANNVVYAISEFDGFGFYALSASGNALSNGGNLPHVVADPYGSKIVVSGNYAYIAAGSSGFKIINISSPFSPALTSTFNDSGLITSPYYVAVTGNLLCSANGDFKVFDVTQPTHPALVGQNGAFGSKLVAGSGKVYAVSNTAINVISLTTPSSPQIIATIPASVVIPFKMALVGTRLYVVGQSQANVARFVALDVSTPSAPTILGTKDFSDLGYGIATTLAVTGNKAIVGIPRSDASTLRVLDISTINDPQQVGILNGITSTGIALSGDGNYACVIGGSYPASFTIVALTNPASPSIITNVIFDTSSQTASGIDVRGTELFVASLNGVYVFDISNPASPLLAASYSVLSGVQSLVAPSDSQNQNNIVYVADANGGVVVLREQDTQAPNIYITDPIFGTAWATTTSSTDLGGGSDDNVGVTAVTWANDRGGSGIISAPFDSWYVTGIKLYPGTNNITASAFDAAGNLGSNTLAIFYQTTNQNQTITFPAIADHIFGDPGITLGAAASSGLPVTFSVVSGPATLAGNNTLVLAGAGPVTVQASQPGNSSYYPAPSTNVTFTVARANQAITFAPLPAKAATDAPFALMGTTSSGLPVYFSVLAGPATLIGNNLTILGGGTVTVLAYQPGNSNYNAAATVQQAFTVSKIPQSIAFGAMSQQRVGDASFPISASASSGLPVSFSVLSGPASLTGNTLTLTGAGTVTVRASQSGNNVYAKAGNMDQSLTVLPPSNTIGNPQYTIGGFNFTFYGTVGSNYVFQASTNLVNWTNLIIFNCTNVIINFQDISATGLTRRFYRAQSQ